MSVSWFFKFILIDEIQPDGKYEFFCVSRSIISPSIMFHLQYSDQFMKDRSERLGFHKIIVETLFGPEDCRSLSLLGRDQFRPLFNFQCPHCGVCYEAIVIEGGDKSGSSRENPAKQC